MSRIGVLLARGAASVLSPAGGGARLTILFYHRVRACGEGLNHWDPTATAFEDEMRLVADGFVPLPLGEAVARLRRGSLPARAACVTFDDGYADNAEVAFPILRRLGIPATFFVATGFLDGRAMWNDQVLEAIARLPHPLDLTAEGLGMVALDTPAARASGALRLLAAIKYRPQPERDALAADLLARAGGWMSAPVMLTRPQVRELRAAGMEIGAHTVTHPILATLDDADARREIAESRADLQDLLREPVTLFAYPNGKPGRDYAPQHVKMVRDLGFAAAVTTVGGVADARSDPWQLPRYMPWDRRPGRFAPRLVQNLLNVHAAGAA